MRQRLTTAKSKSRKGKKVQLLLYSTPEKEKKYPGELGSFADFTNFYRAPTLCQEVFQALGMPQRTTRCTKFLGHVELTHMGDWSHSSVSSLASSTQEYCWREGEAQGSVLDLGAPW